MSAIYVKYLRRNGLWFIERDHEAVCTYHDDMPGGRIEYHDFASRAQARRYVQERYGVSPDVIEWPEAAS